MEQTTAATVTKNENYTVGAEIPNTGPPCRNQPNNCGVPRNIPPILT